MPASTVLPDNAGKYLLDGTINVVADTVKIALLNSAYVPRPSASAWVNSTAYARGTIITSGGRYYEAITAGNSSGALPAFSTVAGGLSTDNTVIWYCWQYMPPPSHSVWGDVSANEVSGAGYTAGGVTLTAKTMTASNRTVSFSAAAAAWTSAIVTARFAMIYKLGTANGVVDPLIAGILLNDDNTDVVVSTSAALTLIWSPSGIFLFNLGV